MIQIQNSNLDFIFSYAKRIHRPLLLDGAMGSLLQQRGIKPHPQLWMSYANLKYSEEVIKAHKAYVNSGADIITTNTFRTNPLSINNSSLKINNYTFVHNSVKLAQEAVVNKNILVAGSNPPAEDCYQVKRTVTKKALESNHTKHIEYLFKAGCDFILNETQSHMDEILFIAKFCNHNSIPYVMSLFFTEELKLLSGENIFNVIKKVEEYNPLAVGMNCVLPQTFNKAFRRLGYEKSWGFYLNCGSGEFKDENITCGISPATYVETSRKYMEKHPAFIGSCCGSSPKHTKELKRLLDE